MTASSNSKKKLSGISDSDKNSNSDARKKLSNRWLSCVKLIIPRSFGFTIKNTEVIKIQRQYLVYDFFCLFSDKFLFFSYLYGKLFFTVTTCIHIFLDRKKT